MRHLLIKSSKVKFILNIIFIYFTKKLISSQATEPWYPWNLFTGWHSKDINIRTLFYLSIRAVWLLFVKYLNKKIELCKTCTPNVMHQNEAKEVKSDLKRHYSEF